MTRQMPQNLGDVMVEVLSSVDSALELTRAAAEASTANSRAVMELVAETRSRPTKQQTLRAITLMNGVALVVLCLVGIFFYSQLRSGQHYIEQQVDVSRQNSARIVCSLLNDNRALHDAGPAEGC